MARKVQVEYTGTLGHVMVRGDHQEVGFADDRDRLRLVETLL